MAGIDLLRSFKSKDGQFFIGGEGQHIQSGDLSGHIAHRGTVKIVVHGIHADQNIADIQFVTQRARHAGVHQMGHTEYTAHDLGAHSRIDLANTALHNHSIQPFQAAFIELAAGNGLLFLIFQGRHQDLHFHIHGADNSEFHILLLTPDKRVCPGLYFQAAQHI